MFFKLEAFAPLVVDFLSKIYSISKIRRAFVGHDDVSIIIQISAQLYNKSHHSRNRHVSVVCSIFEYFWNVF